MFNQQMFGIGLSVHSRDLKQGQTELKNLGDQGEKTKGRVTKSTKGIVSDFNSVKVATAAITGALASLGAVTYVLAGHEQQMAKVAAVSGATARKCGLGGKLPLILERRRSSPPSRLAKAWSFWLGRFPHTQG